ncbi:hypothetical protein FIBSPDRAFT_934780, partial [Athelia psychrophila]
MDPDEHSEYTLRVIAAEWTRDTKGQEEDDDLYVEVSVDGARQVLPTMYTKTSHWDQDLKMIEIKSVAHNSSESLSVVRAEISLQNLLEKCADGDEAVLVLAVVPLVSGMVDPAVETDGYMGSKDSAPESIGLMTVKLCRLSHEPPNVLQLRDTCSVSVPQMGQVERRIPEEVAEDLEISNIQQSLALTPDGHPNKPALLSNLGESYRARFGRLGDLADLEHSIASLEQALALTLYGHPNKPDTLTSLGNSYQTRFLRLGDLADGNNAIASWEQGLALTPDVHLVKANRLSNIGAGYRARFERLGDHADLEHSIASLEQAVTYGHPDKLRFLSNLCVSYDTRFERLGGLTDLENS